MIKIGPAGIGSVIDAASNLEKYYKMGFRACEIPFTYSVFIKEDKHKKQIKDIYETVKKLDFNLSIHAPYWINLNSAEKIKVVNSKKRILNSCKIAHLIGAKRVVFHCGYYGKDSKEKTYQSIKKEILDMMKTIKAKKWKVKLCPETMGKINVFGSTEEILRLVKETKCDFCLDFAHLHARSLGKMTYKEMYKKYKGFKKLHCHFSGIIFGDKGERSHKMTPSKELKGLLAALPKNKDITIISESPDPVKDSRKALKILKGV